MLTNIIEISVIVFSNIEGVCIMKLEITKDIVCLSSGDLVCLLNPEDGRLQSITDCHFQLAFDGITMDVGCDGIYLLKTLAFDNMLEKHTWDLPIISPNRYSDMPQFLGFEERNNVLAARYKMGPIEATLIYSFVAGTLKVHTEISNLTDKELWLNGLAFITKLKADSTFDFPSNTPNGEFDSKTLPLYQPVCTPLINSCVHSEVEGGHFNLAFVDPIEKWGSGVWKSETGTDYAYVPNLEVMLKPNETILCGDLYFQLVADGNPYLRISKLYEDLGYKAARGGINYGIMYSCHPHGPMDTNFHLRNNMVEYAGYLDELKDLGIDHVWLLPIFAHPQDENGYHSTDQAIIDARYGTDADVKYFCDKAHSLGMTVLFDYVPHGPSPDEPLAKDHLEWCSRRQDGSLHDEWHCVSFDYNHPGYQEYTTNLVYDHVKRFGIDGARIDCAMGGLSNWRPYGDNRPSGNSVKAGVNISKFTREGFLKGGKTPFNLPENFNPIPCYYPYTDVFYGMNLYRVLCELDNIIHSNPAEYVEHLTSWLEKEYWATPAGYTKIRFLGNHDTVSWVFQSTRAVDYYGLETAKALWAVITLIDGMPMIYQGDEDPKLYLKENGVVLKDFFKKLFSDRKQFIGESKEIEYIYTGTPVMAFIRPVEGKKRLVLINLSNDSQTLGFDTVNMTNGNLLAGNGQISGTSVTIPPYQYGIFEL